MNAETFLEVLEDAVRPLECGATPSFRMTGTKQGVYLFLEAEFLDQGVPIVRQGKKRCHVPLNISALKRVDAAKFKQMICDARYSINQALLG